MDDGREERKQGETRERESEGKERRDGEAPALRPILFIEVRG